MQCVENCNSNDPSKKPEYFEQPVWQTLNMFVGETLCFFAVYVILVWEQHNGVVYSPIENDTPSSDDSEIIVNLSENEALVAPSVVKIKDQNEDLNGLKIFLFWLPTMCDILGTTLMNVGLIYTSASVYQMLRGAVVLFTGIFSVVFLKRTLLAYHWFSLFLVVLGVTIVGMSSILFPPKKPSDLIVIPSSISELPNSSEALIGVLLVLIAQLFTASQFVLEEKIMLKYRVKPLRAVGLEGIFGLITVIVGMIVLHFTYGVTHPGGYFNISTGFHQIIDNSGVWKAGLAICFSIAFFNFFGLSVTRSISATARSTIDTTRIVFIWLVSLFLGWETFSWLQVIGFVVLIMGTFMFNGVINPPSFLAPSPSNQVPTTENDPLLSEDHSQL
ncbi:hypothetical protein G9A89_005102 [Geosiphon pyriformis]|nr:hypothetical protein G9A89_005102 [Geosiphon pyriformis]